MVSAPASIGRGARANRPGLPAFALRPMVEADIGGVLAIEREWAPAPWSESTFANELGVPFSRASVLHDVRAPEGVAGYRVRWLVAGEMHLLSLAVAPALRGRGLGGVMLDDLLSEAWDEDVDLVTLEVEAENAAAIGLYTSRGFAPVRRRSGYYGAERDALVMEIRGGCRGVS